MVLSVDITFELFTELIRYTVDVEPLNFTANIRKIKWSLFTLTKIYFIRIISLYITFMFIV